MITLYHSTIWDNLNSILSKGLIPGTDHVIYFCETPVDSAKFLYIRGIKEFVSLKIDLPDSFYSHIKESFDHSYDFFKCKAFSCDISIPAKYIDFNGSIKYDLN